MPDENTFPVTTTTGSELNINVLQLKKAALCLRALNHGLRQQMLQLIHKKEKVIVTEIYQNLGLEQSVASQHLAILRRSGFVLTTRSGKCIYYHVHYERLEEVKKLIDDMLQ
jgi:DNA-binding transcriptional ArsR family regulator